MQTFVAPPPLACAQFSGDDHNMKQLLSILALIALFACDAPTAIAPSAPMLPSAENDTCNGLQHAALVGQDATALERVLILGQVRVIRPDMAVTMDFRPERLNFDIGSLNRITRIFCG